MAIKETGSRPGQLSEEYIQDSSDEGEETEKSDSVEDESSAEAGEDDPSKIPTPNGFGSASPQHDDHVDASSDSSSDSSSSEDGDNGSDGEGSEVSGGSRKRSREAEKSTGTSQSAKKQKKSKLEVPVRIASKPFKPPMGFGSIVYDASDYASETVQIFGDLSNKQVWHISAPASLNISSIKHFDIAAALKGNPIVTDNGVSYSLQPTTSSADTLLLPEDADGTYRPSNTRISRGFQLKPVDEQDYNMSNAPSSEHSDTGMAESLRFTAQVPGQPKPPRQQPAGLKTRYVPYGVIDRDTTKSLRTFPGLDDYAAGESVATNIYRTPLRAGKSAPAVSGDPMDLDDNSSTTRALQRSPVKPVDPSPAKSSASDTPRAKEKKRKKRSRLVDSSEL